MHDRSIIIADDESHLRVFLKMIAKEIGFGIIREAANGREALNLHLKQPADLVLLDINMTQMDGLEALEAIRAQDPEAKVVMVTSVASRQVVEKSIQLGAISYFRKDVPPDQLKKNLRTVVGKVFGATAESRASAGHPAKGSVSF